MGDGASEVRWPGRLKQAQVRQLYAHDARGILDDELIEEAGMTLYLRVQAILVIKAAHEGKVQCPRCAQAGQSQIIPRRTHDPLECLHCVVCGWTCTWGQYHRTFKGKQLNSGGAVAGFAHFLHCWERAKTAKDKWLAIDQVIHAFHYSNREKPKEPSRPAGVNLIEGNLTSVVRFLTDLSAGTLTPKVGQTARAWREEYQRLPWLTAWVGRGVGPGEQK